MTVRARRTRSLPAPQMFHKMSFCSELKARFMAFAAARISRLYSRTQTGWRFQKVWLQITSLLGRHFWWIDSCHTWAALAKSEILCVWAAASDIRDVIFFYCENIIIVLQFCKKVNVKHNYLLIEITVICLHFWMGKKMGFSGWMFLSVNFSILGRKGELRGLFSCFTLYKNKQTMVLCLK